MLETLMNEIGWRCRWEVEAMRLISIVLSGVIAVSFCCLVWAEEPGHTPNKPLPEDIIWDDESPATEPISGPIIGFITKGPNPEYRISSFDFGIEQWKNEKRSTTRYQRWILSCLSNSAQTYCSLERMVFNDYRPKFPNVGVSTYEHSTTDGTLKILKDNWKDGKLNFGFTHIDESYTEVTLTMKYRGDFIYLDSFKAFTMGREDMSSDSMTIFQHKIPEYTYILNVPIEIGGLKSADDKEWDEMFNTLSKQDQMALEKLRQEIEKKWFTFGSCEEFGKKIIPKYEKRKEEIEKGSKFLPEEEKKFIEAVNEGLGKCLTDIGISPEGRDKVISLLEKSLEILP